MTEQTRKTLLIFLQILVALYLAKYLGDLILKNNYFVVFGLMAGFVLFTFSTWKQKFYVFTLASLIPLSMPRAIKIPIDMWIQIIGPLLFFMFIIEIINKKRSFFSRNSNIFFIAVGVLALWALIHYISNPVLGRQSFGAGEGQRGIRAYYQVFVGITTFFVSFCFFRYRKIDTTKFLIFILAVSLIIGYLRLVGFFGKFNIPFLGAMFKNQFYREGASFFRIGGLTYVISIGIPATFCLYYKKKLDSLAIVILVGLFVLLFMGGGRGIMIGTAVGIIAYIALIQRKHLVPLISGLVLFVVIYVLLATVTSIPLTKQSERMMAISGGVSQQSVGRAATFRYMWAAFKASPLFGKGIGQLDVSDVEGIDLSDLIDTSKTAGMHSYYKTKFNMKQREDLEDFALHQLKLGGHGAYLSIISTFGIGGAFFIVVMMFGSILYAFRICRQSDRSDDDIKLALFVFVYGLIISFVFVIGGKGYDRPELWYIAGMIAGINDRERHNAEQITEY